MIPIYERFARDWEDCLDFSEKSLLDLYNLESRGIGSVEPNNGYAHGKKWMDVQITMWKEDLFRTIWPQDLYDEFPHWWLDKIFPHANEWRRIGLVDDRII